MNSRIKGSPELLRIVENATPFNTNIHVNLEALQELPEQFDAVLKRVRFDPNNLGDNFTEISGKWLPKPQLMYDIAEARGVSGTDLYEAESVYETVDINPMIMKGYEDQPTMRMMHVAYKTTKQAKVTEDDGTISTGAPCTSIDTFWNDCLKAWSKEKEETQGYDPSIVKNGKFSVNFGKKKVEKFGNYIEKTGQYGLYCVELKFDTKYKREAFYEAQKDLSLNMTQSKAWLKCIREKAGLITAYETKDLLSGELIFSKIVKSSNSLKLESLANLDAIRNGRGSKVAQNLLFGKDESEVEPEVKNVTEEEIVEPEPTASATPVEEAIAEIECYLSSPYSTDNDFKKKMMGAVNWLKNNPDADKSDTWNNVSVDLDTIRELMG